MITFYYGTDAWRLRHASRTFQATVRIDGTSASASDELEHLLKYPGFFGQKTSVVVSDPLAIVGLPELLKDTDADSLTDVHLLLVHRNVPKETDDNKKILARLIRMAGTATEFTPLKGAKLLLWVRDYCSEIGGRIESGAAEELLMRTGGESWAIANELEKLCAYTGGDISLGSVRTLVSQPAQEDDWELSNALAARNKRGAISALYRRIAAGAPEQLLIGSLASTLRSLMMVRELTDRGSSSALIAKTTGLHPFVVSKTLRGSRLYEPSALRDAHQNLAQLDRSIKDGLSDGADGLFRILMAL